jgi:PhnB protein
MPTVLAPYVNFRGTAREAMEFYATALGGELQVTTFREGGVTQWPDQLDKVMHSRLATPAGFVLFGSDVPETMDVTFGDNVQIMLGGDDEAALTACWNGLSDGATILTPLDRAPWGDSFGQLLDRFAVRWMVNIAGTPESQV